MMVRSLFLMLVRWAGRISPLFRDLQRGALPLIHFLPRVATRARAGRGWSPPYPPSACLPLIPPPRSFLSFCRRPQVKKWKSTPVKENGLPVTIPMHVKKGDTIKVCNVTLYKP